MKILDSVVKSEKTRIPVDATTGKITVDTMSLLTRVDDKLRSFGLEFVVDYAEEVVLGVASMVAYIEVQKRKHKRTRRTRKEMLG